MHMCMLEWRGGQQKLRVHTCVSVCMFVCVYVDVTHTVGSESLGKELVVYEISIHVLPTSASPTRTHLMFCILFAMTTM